MDVHVQADSLFYQYKYINAVRGVLVLDDWISISTGRIF
jgi:hypothetical protein